MVAAINQIGHTVGAKTIAEFVEDDASLKCLRDMNVDYAQGYGLRMPTPLEQLADELEKRQEGDSGHVEIVDDTTLKSAPDEDLDPDQNNTFPDDYRKAS